VQEREKRYPHQARTPDHAGHLAAGRKQRRRRAGRLEQQLAYTTVQTMLNILARKGKLKRKLRGRAYEYSATVTEARASGHALRDLVDRMFGGSSEELVMSLMKNPPDRRPQIAELSKRFEAEKSGE